jgi:hypothetical protein
MRTDSPLLPHLNGMYCVRVSLRPVKYSLRNTKEKGFVGNLCISLVHGNPIPGAPPPPPCRRLSRFQRRQVSRSVPPYCGKQLPLLPALRKKFQPVKKIVCLHWPMGQSLVTRKVFLYDDIH